ncbi:MAG: hypothetical protein K1060chlam3_00327 [Candidatus Anoxychlamydiales bacterium]|nr:hypothetical protein [Candidatus Anoxychlamydiales bacterium]
MSSSLPPTISEMSSKDIERYIRYERSASNQGAWLETRSFYSVSSEESKSYEAGVDYRPFLEIIKRLTPEDIIFDSGCGTGTAGEDYVKTCPKGAVFYAVGITPPRNPEDDIEWLKRDHLEHLHIFLHDMLEFPTDSLHGRVSVVIDIHGAFRYSGQPSKILAKLAEMLKVGGMLFLTFGNNNTVDVSPYEDKITILARKKLMDQGSNALLFLYLTSIQGLKTIVPQKLTSDEALKRLGLSKNSFFNRDLLINNPFKRQTISWGFVRTEEPIALDPLYIDKEKPQTFNGIEIQKYCWEVSNRNKKLLEKVDRIEI